LASTRQYAPEELVEIQISLACKVKNRVEVIKGVPIEKIDTDTIHQALQQRLVIDVLGPRLKRKPLRAMMEFAR
jgi:hypothetical protein